ASSRPSPTADVRSPKPGLGRRAPPIPSRRPDGGLVTTLVSLCAVTKRYGRVLALDRLDLDIHRGELLALLGPNGAGKTTAISLMLGLQRPDSGQVHLFGDSPQRLEPRRRIGVMMQDAALVPELRVRELIDLTASYYPAPMTPESAMELTNTVS